MFLILPRGVDMTTIKRSCIVLVLLSVFCLEAMEQEAKPVRRSRNRNVAMRKKESKGKEYIDLAPALIKDIEYHTGTNIQFFKEYGAQNKSDGTVSFPKKKTDPVPIKTFGSLRYFFPSASVSNRGPELAMPLLISDQETVEQVIAVRGRASNNHKVYVYLGINRDNGKKVGYKGSNTVYAATIVAMQRKNLFYDCKAQCELYFYDGKEYSEPNWGKIEILHNMKMFQELKKYLDDKKDWDAKSPKYQEKVKELLGDDYKFWNQKPHLLKSDVVYWTETENRLKGTQYKKDS